MRPLLGLIVVILFAAANSNEYSGEDAFTSSSASSATGTRAFITGRLMQALLSAPKSRSSTADPASPPKAPITKEEETNTSTLLEAPLSDQNATTLVESNAGSIPPATLNLTGRTPSYHNHVLGPKPARKKPNSRFMVLFIVAALIGLISAIFFTLSLFKLLCPVA